MSSAGANNGSYGCRPARAAAPPNGHPLKGAGINASDGKVAYCDGRYK